MSSAFYRVPHGFPLDIPNWSTPTRLLSRVLDLGMFGGSLLAIAEPNWLGIAGLVTAIGAVYYKGRELDLKIKELDVEKLRIQSRDHGERLDALDANRTERPNDANDRSGPKPPQIVPPQ